MLASMALAAVLVYVATVLSATPVLGQTASVTLVGAGDIASCNYTADSATARLLGRIQGAEDAGRFAKTLGSVAAREAVT